MRTFAEKLHRCFYALALPPQLNRTLAAVIAGLRRRDDGAVRWTPPQNLHLTLRFLGELNGKEFGEGKALLQNLTFGDGIRLKLGEADGFPSLRKPSVLVLSAEGAGKEEHGKLLDLQRTTEEFARRIGLEPEPRPFRPHITLGRIRRDRSISPELRNGLNALRPEEFGETEGEITSLHLMESIMKPTGVEYRVAAGSGGGWVL